MVLYFALFEKRCQIFVRLNTSVMTQRPGSSLLMFFMSKASLASGIISRDGELTLNKSCVTSDLILSFTSLLTELTRCRWDKELVVIVWTTGALDDKICLVWSDCVEYESFEEAVVVITVPLFSINGTAVVSINDSSSYEVKSMTGGFLYNKIHDYGFVD